MKKCNHGSDHKEVLGHVLCVCCSHCIDRVEAFREVEKNAENLVKHIEMLLGDKKISGTYHLKERLKEALRGVKE